MESSTSIELLFTTPLEKNLSNLILGQQAKWENRFETFLNFIKKIRDFQLERGKFIEYHSNKKITEFLPRKCSKWNEESCKKALEFVRNFDEEFYPKVYEEYKRILKKGEEFDVILSTDNTGNSLKLRSIEKIIKHFNALLAFFKSKSNVKITNDPWINEMAIRHHSAIFLIEKETFLSDLQRIYYESRTMERECSDKMNEFVSEFLVNVKGFETTTSSLYDINNNNNNNDVDVDVNFDSDWSKILEEYNLNYEWRVDCAPLDGFISTLFNYLKSIYDFTSFCGYTLHHTHQTPQSRTSIDIPRLIPEELRVGFLQRSSPSLLSRSWQTIFVLFQKSTKFLHIYKSFLKGTDSNAGKLMIPTSGTLYSKASLTDMSLLVSQYLRESPHQPASIASELLSPNSSIKITEKTLVSAADPAIFSFQIRTENDKFTFKAFCEEDFVDWIIVFNDSIKSLNQQISKSTSASSDNNDAVTIQENKQEGQERYLAPHSRYNNTTTEHEEITSSSTNTNTSTAHTNSTAYYSNPSAPSVNFADIEDPWS